MLPTVSLSRIETPDDLGRCYVYYRALITFSITILLLSIFGQWPHSPRYAELLLVFLIVYAGLNLFQFLKYKYHITKPGQSAQATLYLDVIALSLCALSLAQYALLLGILSLSTIIAASALLNRLQALLITLTLVITIGTPSIYLFLSQSVELELLVNHALTVLLLLSSYVFSQLFKQRFMLLLAQHQHQNMLASLGQRTAIIAHEIRNPLAIIVQATDLAKQHGDAQSTLLHDMIAQQAQRIDQTIRDTLETIQNKRCFRSQINLNKFIPTLLQQDLPDIQYAVHYEIEPDLQIMFDALQLRQVLINLIRNAIRHNSRDIGFIQLKLYGTTPSVIIEVFDFGRGVKRADLAQLFTAFFSTEKNGIGLGLFISQQYCEQNQAKLTYFEQKQQGACFKIECPRII